MNIRRRNINLRVYGAFIQKWADRPGEGFEMTENEQEHLKMSERSLSRGLFRLRNRHEIVIRSFIITVS